MDPTENTQPVVDPNTQPGGQSYEHMRTLQTQTATENNSLRTKLAEMEAKIEQLASPPPQSQPTNDSGTEETFDFRKGMMRLDDGKINPTLLKTFDKIGIDEELGEHFVQRMEHSVEYDNYLNTKTINETVGSQEQFDSMLGWGKDNLDPNTFSRISAGLQSRDMMRYAITDLMSQAQAGGFQLNTQQPVSNEPRPIPNTASSSSASMAPLLPGSEELIQAVGDPRYLSDPSYRQTIKQRTEAGMKLQQ